MDIISQAKRQELLVAIESLRLKVEQWRKTRTVNEHMPEPLWEEATALAKTYGVAAVQGILRIDYRGLKRRTLGLPAPAPAPKTPPRFVELPPLLTPARRPEHTVELEDGVGRRLIVKIAGGNLAEVLPLVQAFWRP
jgi:hypothetical protein